MSYNGWSNYETWNVNLWLDNDYQEEVYAIIKHNKTRWDAAAAIRDFVQGLGDSLGLPNGMFKDILESSLSEVDWPEIVDFHSEEDQWEEEEDGQPV